MLRGQGRRKDGKREFTLFYPKTGSLDFTKITAVKTLCLFTPERHMFMDLTVGIRVEHLGTVKVLDSSLDDVIGMLTAAFKVEVQCWYCNLFEGNADLQTCSRCKV